MHSAWRVKRQHGELQLPTGLFPVVSKGCWGQVLGGSIDCRSGARSFCYCAWSKGIQYGSVQSGTRGTIAIHALTTQALRKWIYPQECGRKTINTKEYTGRLRVVHNISTCYPHPVTPCSPASYGITWREKDERIFCTGLALSIPLANLPLGTGVIHRLPTAGVLRVCTSLPPPSRSISRVGDARNGTWYGAG